MVNSYAIEIYSWQDDNFEYTTVYKLIDLDIGFGLVVDNIKLFELLIYGFKVNNIRLKSDGGVIEEAMKLYKYYYSCCLGISNKERCIEVLRKRATMLELEIVPFREVRKRYVQGVITTGVGRGLKVVRKEGLWQEFIRDMDSHGDSSNEIDIELELQTKKLKLLGLDSVRFCGVNLVAVKKIDKNIHEYNNIDCYYKFGNKKIDLRLERMMNTIAI